MLQAPGEGEFHMPGNFIENYSVQDFHSKMHTPLLLFSHRNNAPDRWGLKRIQSVRRALKELN